MIKSMTAFANSETELTMLRLNCELRSVNHRYCDINIKIPEKFLFAENHIRYIISKKIKRGKVECHLRLKKTGDAAQFIGINQATVTAILKATAEIEQQMHNSRPFSALELLMLPNVQMEAPDDLERLEQAIYRLIETSVEKLLMARQREGQQLNKMLETRCLQLQDFVEEASERLPQVLQQLRTKIMGRINELKIQADFDRLEQEIIFLTQKMDVDEEIDRLRTHSHEVLRLLKQEEPVGRRLDFLMQEMNREANTLGSKSGDKQMTQIAIELKVLIEQMREQVQNIE